MFTANVVYESLIYEYPETSANGYITSDLATLLTWSTFHFCLLLCFEVPFHRNLFYIYF